MVWQTLLICLLTVFEQYHTTEGAWREVAPLQSSLPSCMTEYVNHAYWRERSLLLGLSAFGCFGFDIGQQLSSSPHKYFHLSIWLTLVKPSLPLSKCGIVVCHKVSPFASTTALLA